MSVVLGAKHRNRRRKTPHGSASGTVEGGSQEKQATRHSPDRSASGTVRDISGPLPPACVSFPFDVEVHLLYDDGNDDYTFDNGISSQRQGRRHRHAPAPPPPSCPADMIAAHARAASLANGGTDFIKPHYVGRQQSLSFRGRRPVFQPVAQDPDEDVEFYAEWPEQLGGHVSCKPLAVWDSTYVHCVGEGLAVEEFPRDEWLKKFRWKDYCHYGEVPGQTPTSASGSWATAGATRQE